MIVIQQLTFGKRGVDLSMTDPMQCEGLFSTEGLWYKVVLINHGSSKFTVTDRAKVRFHMRNYNTSSCELKHHFGKTAR